MPRVRAHQGGAGEYLMRYLCFDIGDKRTGIASGSDELKIASPVEVIECALVSDGSALIDRLMKVIEEHEPDALVIGLPINMDGTEGPRAKSMRTLADRLAERSGLTVHLFDERLTSAEADWSMANTGMTHGQKKAKRDAIAAAHILRGFFESSGDQAD